MAGLTCDIVTPEAKLFTGEATMVAVPGTEGQMGFLQGHVPLVSALADGTVRVVNDADEKVFVCMGGYVETDGKKVIVLADRAQLKDDIDVAAVKAELSALNAKLEALDEQDQNRLIVLSDIEWAKARLAALGTEE